MRNRRLRSTFAAAVLATFVHAPIQAQTKLDVTIFHTERDFYAGMLRWWMAEVEKRTSNRVQMRAHYSGSLVKVTETLDAVRNGVVPVGLTAPSVTSGTIPAMAYLEIFGGFPSAPSDFEKVVVAARPHLAKLFEAQGVVYLWQQAGLAGAVACRNKHLLSPADWKGMKVRVAGRWQAQQIQALGAIPMTTDPAEQYIALQNGTVDCVLTINTLGLSLRLYEVAPKYTHLRLPVNSMMYVMNARAWATLAQQDRQAIEAVSLEAEKRSLPHLLAAQEDAENKLKAAGADYKSISDENLKAFLRAALLPVVANIDKAAGDAGKPLANLLRGFW
jgi:TRAP-type C4-dicarboxylate transport system substrate-binding protein